MQITISFDVQEIGKLPSPQNIFKSEKMYLDNNVTGQTVDRHIRTTRIHAQSVGEVSPQCIQVTLGLLNLVELLGAAGFCNKVYGQLIGSSTTNKVWKVVKLKSRSWLGGLGGNSRSRGDLLFQSLRLATKLGQERAGLMDGERGRGDRGQAL